MPNHKAKFLKFGIKTANLVTLTVALIQKRMSGLHGGK